jgi:hypothetical protein
MASKQSTIAAINRRMRDPRFTSFEASARANICGSEVLLQDPD